MFLLNIPQPCHENWADMSPDSRGRFCGSCQKIVVDFTAMSDEEVKNYLLDKRHQQTCGRFLTSQIGRPLENQTVSIDKKWYAQLPYAKQVFYAFAVFFVLGASSCNWETKGEPQIVQQIPSPDTITISTPMGEPVYTDTVAFSAPDPIKKASIFTEPMLTGDVTMGAPEWTPEPDTPRMVVGKIAAPPPDTVKPELMIMGGISVPLPQDSSVRPK
ncbi:MAG TPA: hypothetical protein VL092_09420 [Chitinophagaceae bacterium]|nr:hypothetical protein [Chitinophagaceae bacterium]